MEEMKNEETMMNLVVTEQQLPEIVTEQISQIHDLEDKVAEAVEKASNAKESAEHAYYHGAGFGEKRAAIELLQTATKNLAEAQISSTEAQQLLFEYQTKLAEIMKRLFGLGVMNLTMNRTMVRELELRLKGASEEEISELAKQELRNVIVQLKAQEDIMRKQEFLTEKVKETTKQVKSLDQQMEEKTNIDSAQDEKLEEYAIRLGKQDEAMDLRQQKDEEHDKRLDEKDLLDEQHSSAIAKLEESSRVQQDTLSRLEESLQAHQVALDAKDTQIQEMEKSFAAFTQSCDETLKKLQDDLMRTERSTDSAIGGLTKGFYGEFGTLHDTINQSKEQFEKGVQHMEDELGQFTDDFNDFKDKTQGEMGKIKGEIKALSADVEKLFTMSKRKVWKDIVVGAASLSALGALVLTILQLLQIL